MTKRTKTGQKKHDEAVLRTVKNYESKGYNVKADLPGYPKPKNIKGHIPDVIAIKGAIEKIVEIETNVTKDKDKKQHEAFKDYASKKKKREFRKRII
jgi:hypothetical protein